VNEIRNIWYAELICHKPITKMALGKGDFNLFYHASPCDIVTATGDWEHRIESDDPHVVVPKEPFEAMRMSRVLELAGVEPQQITFCEQLHEFFFLAELGFTGKEAADML